MFKDSHLSCIAVVALALAVAGCDTSTESADAGHHTDAGVSGTDAGNPTGDAGSHDVDAGSNDTDAGTHGADAGSNDTDAGAACVDECATTLLTATFGAATGTFDRAQHGLEDDGNLYVEAHFGGDPACPTESSPTPARTLIIAGLRPVSGPQTYDDGVRVTLLDFTGVLTTAPLVRATAVTASARFIEPGTLVSFTLDATFGASGTLSGGFAAGHCDSLDAP